MWPCPHRLANKYKMSEWLCLQCRLYFWGLLLCCGGPNLGSLSSWIARWIKKSLEWSGLEPTFSTHSTRSAESCLGCSLRRSWTEWVGPAWTLFVDTISDQSEFCTAKRLGDAVLGYKHAKDMLVELEPPEVQSTHGQDHMSDWMLFEIVWGGQRRDQHVLPSHPTRGWLSILMIPYADNLELFYTHKSAGVFDCICCSCIYIGLSYICHYVLKLLIFEWLITNITEKWFAVSRTDLE